MSCHADFYSVVPSHRLRIPRCLVHPRRERFPFPAQPPPPARAAGIPRRLRAPPGLTQPASRGCREAAERQGRRFPILRPAGISPSAPPLLHFPPTLSSLSVAIPAGGRAPSPGAGRADVHPCLAGRESILPFQPPSNHDPSSGEFQPGHCSSCARRIPLRVSPRGAASAKSPNRPSNHSWGC